MIDSIIKMLGVSKNTYWNYKRQKRPIILFLEKYFTDEDLEEFLTTGKIKKLEEKEDHYLTFMLVDYVKYNLKEKLDKILLKPGVFKWLENIIPKKIFFNILKEIRDDPKIEIEKYKSKEYLIKKIESYKVVPLNNSNKKQLIDIIKKNLSNIECYVLIKYAEEFLEDK